MTTTPAAPAKAVTYPKSRAQSLSAWHRQWVVSRYPGSRARSHMSERLGIPSYRPLFNPDTYYGDIMTPLVDHVVKQAVSAAKTKARHGNLESVPVVSAIREVITKSRKA